MKKVIIAVTAIVLLMLTGCANRQVVNHNYIYKGENECWIAEYKVNGTGIFTEKNHKTEYESNKNDILTVTYKKDLKELSSVKNLEISYESSAGGGRLNLSFDDKSPYEKTYTLKSGGRGGAIEHKDETIKVSISLDGKTEIIELKDLQ